jgi:hypothetical protein
MRYLTALNHMARRNDSDANIIFHLRTMPSAVLRRTLTGLSAARDICETDAQLAILDRLERLIKVTLEDRVCVAY